MQSKEPVIGNKFEHSVMTRSVLSSDHAPRIEPNSDAHAFRSNEEKNNIRTNM